MGSSHMQSIMHLAEGHAKKTCGTDNIVDCLHGGRSTFFTQRTWKALIEYWVKQEYKNKGEANRKNRNTKVHGQSSRHRGGSIPFALHEKRMAKDGQEVQFVDLYDTTHNIQTDPGSAEASVAYRARMTAKYGPNSLDWPKNDHEVYIAAFGGPNRGRCRGLGSGEEIGLGINISVPDSSVSTGFSMTTDMSLVHTQIEQMQQNIHHIEEIQQTIQAVQPSIDTSQFLTKEQLYGILVEKEKDNMKWWDTMISQNNEKMVRLIRIGHEEVTKTLSSQLNKDMGNVKLFLSTQLTSTIKDSMHEIELTRAKEKA